MKFLVTYYPNCFKDSNMVSTSIFEGKNKDEIYEKLDFLYGVNLYDCVGIAPLFKYFKISLD